MYSTIHEIMIKIIYNINQYSCCQKIFFVPEHKAERFKAKLESSGYIGVPRLQILQGKFLIGGNVRYALKNEVIMLLTKWCY